MSNLVIALCCTLAGTVLLFLSWRRKLLTLPFKVTTGWVLQLLGLYFWTSYSGIEFGLIYSLLALSVAAWVLVVLNHEQRPSRHDTPEPGNTGQQGRWSVIRENLVLFIAAVPLAGVAAALLSVASVTPLPWSELNRWVLAVFTMPLLWGLLAYWACADSRPARPILGMLFGLSVSSVVLFV